MKYHRETRTNPLVNATKVEIPLKPVAIASEKKLPPNFLNTLQTEYAIKYLEKLGVTPTKDKIDQLLTNFPINNALVIPAWTRETVIIVPDRRFKDSEKSFMNKTYGYIFLFILSLFF